MFAALNKAFGDLRDPMLRKSLYAIAAWSLGFFIVLMIVLFGGIGRVASQPSALGITVSPLDVVPSKLSLPVCQASGLLWQGKPPIGFSVGFCFLQSKGSRERICSLSSVVNVVKCNEIFSTKTTLTTLTTLTTPFPKNFFQKLFRVEFCNDLPPFHKSALESE